MDARRGQGDTRNLCLCLSTEVEIPGSGIHFPKKVVHAETSGSSFFFFGKRETERKTTFCGVPEKRTSRPSDPVQRTGSAVGDGGAPCKFLELSSWRVCLQPNVFPRSEVTSLPNHLQKSRRATCFKQGREKPGQEE